MTLVVDLKSNILFAIDCRRLEEGCCLSRVRREMRDER